MNMILRSLQLDFEFLFIDFPLDKKIEFIYKKYVTLFKNVFSKPVPGVSHTYLWGEKYFYDDIYGLAVLQSAYCDNAQFKTFIKPHSIVIDIGANIGQFNHFAKNYLCAKTIFSFEPVHSTYICLSKNAKKNTYNAAISTHTSLTFYLSRLSVWATSQKQEGLIRQEKVVGMVLDKIPEIKKLKKIHLLKIDVEGAEKDVILASQASIKKSEYILIEVSLERSAETDIIDLLNLLKKVSPHIRLVKIGRLYSNADTTTGAADLLFSNK